MLSTVTLGAEVSTTPAAVEVAEPLYAPKISVIMPAYNESGRIAECVLRARAHLERILLPYEIIVVDDGSEDGTRAEALSIRDKSHVGVVGYDRNQGKGSALKFGTRYARGEFVVFMDSDADVRPDLVEQYVEILKDADIAIASKWHPESKVSTPLTRRFLSHGFHCLVMLLTGVRVSDTQTGFKAFRREALTKIMNLLSVKRYAFDVEVLTIASMLKMRIVEMPVKIQLGSLFSVREVLRMLIDLLGIAYRLRVIRWYQKNLHNTHAVYKAIIRW